LLVCYLEQLQGAIEYQESMRSELLASNRLDVASLGTVVLSTGKQVRSQILVALLFGND